MSDPASVIPPSSGEIDLTLKRLDKWVKLIGIVGAILGLVLTSISIWNLHIQNNLYKTQQLLFQHQAEEAEAKRELNLGVEIITSPAAGNEVNISLKLSNYSVRQVHIAMVGIRIWKKDWKRADDTFEKHPDLLIYSDSSVVFCQSEVCPKETSKTRLQSTQHQIILAPGPGGAQTEAFGTYSIPRDELKRGIWIQGLAYTLEGVKENCAVVGPPRFEGSFPIFCEESRKNQERCYEKAQCGYEDIAEHYPSLAKK
jgi:hypothetical protein